MKRLVLSVLILSLGACSSDTPSEPSDQTAGFGGLEVTLARAPATPALLFSASVRVGTGTPVELEDGQTRSFSGLSAGTHSLEASGLTSHCAVQGQNPRSVSIVANQVTQVSMEVSCTFDSQPRLVFRWREEGWSSDVWTASPDGSNRQKLTDTQNTLGPELSPDGTRILYYADGQIRVMNFDGTENRSVYSAGGAAAWSGDGTRVAFTFSDGVLGVDPRGIWSMNIDGSDFREVGKATADRLMPGWSHDNQKIAFCEEGKLMVMNADGTSPTALTIAGGCAFPVWSPDDQELAFSFNDPDDEESAQIWQINVDGSGLSPLSESRSHPFAPSYTPDGSSILFHTQHGSPEPAERAWIMDRDGGNQRHFDPIPLVGAQHLRWWAQ